MYLDSEEKPFLQKPWKWIRIYIVLILLLNAFLIYKLQFNPRQELEKLPKFEAHEHGWNQHLHYTPQMQEMARGVDQVLRQSSLYALFLRKQSEYLLDNPQNPTLSLNFDPLVQNSTDGRAYLYVLKKQIAEKTALEVKLKIAPLDQSLDQAEPYADSLESQLDWTVPPAQPESDEAIRSRVVQELDFLVHCCQDIARLGRNDLVLPELPLQMDFTLWPMHIQIHETADFNPWSKKIFPTAGAQAKARALLVYGLQQSQIKDQENQAQKAALFFSQMKSQISSLNAQELAQIMQEEQ